MNFSLNTDPLEVICALSDYLMILTNSGENDENLGFKFIFCLEECVKPIEF
jgi:hypothetical protein